MPSYIAQPKAILPDDHRHRQGGMLFLVSLLVFFLSSILLYSLYAHWRRDDPQTNATLPPAFLISTGCLIAISGLVHMATRTIRREKRRATCLLLCLSAATAIVFVGVQYQSMARLLNGPALEGGTGKGVAGMVVVLVFLHAIHVGGGIIALGIVSTRSLLGRYDHERHWPVDFAAQYWHFLDLVWLAMLIAFWTTTGGFVLW